MGKQCACYGVCGGVFVIPCCTLIIRVQGRLIHRYAIHGNTPPSSPCSSKDSHFACARLHVSERKEERLKICAVEHLAAVVVDLAAAKPVAWVARERRHLQPQAAGTRAPTFFMLALMALSKPRKLGVSTGQMTPSRLSILCVMRVDGAHDVCWQHFRALQGTSGKGHY